MTFCCAVEVYTITNSTPENGGIKECQHIRSSELLENPIGSRIMIKNGEYNKRETTDNHMLQQNVYQPPYKVSSFFQSIYCGTS